MSRKPRVDINSLPPEIVSQIVQHIVDLDQEEREDLARNPFGDRIPFDMAPNGLLEALLGAGGLGGLLNLGAGHQPPVPPVNPAGFDDMPALEDVSDDEPPPPVRAAPPGRTPAPAAARAPAAPAPARAVPPSNPVRTAAQRPIDLDSMPPLESISSDDEAPPLRSRATPTPAASRTPRPNGRPVPTPDSDDEMPSLEAIPRPSPSVAARQPTPARTSAPTATVRNATRATVIVDSDEDLPPLEDIAAPVRSTASKPNHSADSDMPELEPIDDLPSTSRATPQASGSTTSPVKKKAFAFSFPKAGTAGKAKTPTPAPAPTPAQPFSFSFPAAVPTPAAPVSTAYSEMPALEDISDDDPPDVELPPRQSAPQVRRPAPSARSSEDDLPPLESIPSAAPKSTPKKKPAAKKSAPAPTGGLSNAYDDMPSLEGISSDEGVAAPPPPKASKSKKKKKKAAAAPVPNDGLPPLEGIDSDDDVPAVSKKPISAKAKAQAAAAKSTPSPAPPSNKANNNAKAGKMPGRYDSDDDLPPLEPIDTKLKGKGKASTSTPAVKPTPAPLPPPPPPVVESSSDENMPALDDASESSESESDDSDEEKKPEKAADTSDSDSDDEDSDDDNDHSASGGAGEGGASSSEYKEADDYEGDSEGGNGNNEPSTSKKGEGAAGSSKAAGSDIFSKMSEEDQKVVENVITALATSHTSSSDGSKSPDYVDSDEEDEDQEWDEDDDEDIDDDEDDDDDDDSSDEDVTFKDGLPSEPLLPLIFSKPFLHAARQKLYRNITLKSPYQASLLLRSLSAPQHAARDPVEDLDDSISNSKNSLAHMTRSLEIVPVPGEFSDPREGEKDISGGRGGADVYVDIIQLCTLLEKLVLAPGFLKSMTKPLLKALENLSRLKAVHLSSGSDAERPLLFTTARIIRLMRYHWPELEALTVIRIAPAEEGPTSEEDRMWMEEGFMNEMEPEAAKAVTKRKGLVSLELREPNATHNELSIILRDSAMTLKTLVIDNPTSALDRYGLASIILRFGSTLTELVLAAPGNWHPRSKPSSRVNPPARVKNYVHGSPSSAMLGAIDNYVYFLDAVVPYLPHLFKLQWDGELASTSVFSFLSVSLKYINWSHCPAVAPGPLAKLLRKTVNRSKTVQNPDGTTTSKTIRTIVAKGLKCITIEHDDRTWSDTDLNALNEAAIERNCCLHLTGGRNAGAGGLPAGQHPNPEDLLGLFGGMLPGGLVAAMGLPIGMGVDIGI